MGALNSLCERRAGADDPQKAAEAKEHRKKGNDSFKRKEYLQAAAEYSEALKLTPTDAALYVNRSIAFRQLNLFDKAVEDANTAIGWNPSNEKAHYGKALALKNLGKTAEATAACKAGLAVQPENKPLLELEEALKPLRVRAEVGPLAAQNKIKAAKDEAAKAKATPKAAVKKNYNVDYSKWKDVNSDSEEEDKPAQGPMSPQEIEKEAQKVIPTGLKGATATVAERNYIVEEMMKMIKKVREASLAEVRTAAEKDSVGTDFESKLVMNEGPQVTTKNLPADYRKPIGIISIEDLHKFSASSDRNLVSVYGDIFDVSNRVDVYGTGKKSTWSGQDVTWALIIGDESNKKFNEFYDIFKLPHDKLERFMRVICHFLVSYNDDHGKPIGRLDKFEDEAALPMPPDEDCKDPCPTQ